METDEAERPAAELEPAGGAPAAAPSAGAAGVPAALKSPLRTAAFEIC